jgi:cell division protein FtsB
MLGMIKMLPIILVVGGAGFAYHKVVINEKDNRITQQQMEIADKTQQNVALQTAAQTNEGTIRKLEQQMKKQAQAFADLTTKNNALESDKSRYMSMVKKHNLTQSARSNPEKIEPKINRGTDRVFRQVEADSRELDEADDTASERAYDSTSESRFYTPRASQSNNRGSKD